MRLYFTLFLTILILIYISTFYIIQTPISRSFYLNSFQSMCSVFDSKFSVARFHTTTPFTTSYVDYFPENCSSVTPPMTWQNSYWTLKLRPIVGDHIHLLYKLYLDGKPVIFHDRNLSEKIAYEKAPEACPSSVDYAYKKSWYHTGVHSHCDRSPSNGGIIHVHPWSAPVQLRVEGRDVNLGMFFESVGIERSTMGKGFLINGKYRKLKLAYYTNVNNNQYNYLTSDEREIQSLWLVDCHGGVILWDENSEMPEISEWDKVYVNKFKCHPKNYPIR
mgnify:CR=1 FL=1